MLAGVKELDPGVKEVAPGGSGGVLLRRFVMASIYSTAWLRMFTLLIFFTLAALGMCLFRMSKPWLTLCTRFLSRAFLLDTFTSCGGGMAYLQGGGKQAYEQE